jgi:N-dimethylarginine dimethylaminohydrolase
MARTIVMGDPTYFSVLGGANPHTRNVLGMRKRVDADRARRQWHALARALSAHGVEVCVIEPHYHGDTVWCSFGAKREHLLTYLDGLGDAAHERVRAEFGANLIALSDRDANLYPANAFQTELEGTLYIFMPRGVSDELIGTVCERGVEPVPCDVSEFLAKGGGSIKCMILDLGPREQQPASGASFRAERSYRRVFGG